MKSKNLSEKIQAEKEKLEKLKNKKIEIEKKIEAIESNLKEYSLLENSSRYVALEKAAENTGLSVDEILKALQSGTLSNLQEQLNLQKIVENPEKNKIESQDKNPETL